jgi:hypothetical protein
VGVQLTGQAVEASNLYIAAYRGGRNECFTYGVDKDKK